MQTMTSLKLRDISIRAIEWSVGKPALTALRTEVFIVEQNVPEEEEWDQLDGVSWHFLADLPAEQAVGCVRLTPKGQISRLAVKAPFRKQGIADALMTTIMQFGAERFDTLFLHAQLPVITFYERLGFVVSGEEFEDAGIMHRPMRWQAPIAGEWQNQRRLDQRALMSPDLGIEEISRATFEQVSDDSSDSSQRPTQGSTTPQAEGNTEYFRAIQNQTTIAIAEVRHGSDIRRLRPVDTHSNEALLALINAIKSKAIRYGSRALRLVDFAWHSDSAAWLGFEPEGDGLNLNIAVPDQIPFAEPNFDPAQALSDKLHARTHFSGFSQTEQTLDLICQTAQRSIKIWSPQLDPELYSRSALQSICSDLARANRHTSIQILIQDNRLIVEQGHYLLELARRLPSSLTIKRTTTNSPQTREDFVLIDDRGIFLRPDYEIMRGWASSDDLISARAYQSRFSKVWTEAETDLELRQLNL